MTDSENCETLPPMPVDCNRIDPIEAYKLRTVNRLTYPEIAKYFGVSKGAVIQRLQALSALMHSKPEHEAYQSVKPMLLSALEEQLIASCTDPAVIEKAGLRDRVVALGIVFDKLRLTTGGSTQNVQVFSRIIIEAEERIGSKTPDKALPLDEKHGNTETPTLEQVSEAIRKSV